jgi:carboxypeptidase Taq
MENLQSNYKKLLEKAKDLAVFQSIEGVIGWDAVTMMPPKGIALRSQQFGLLESIKHQMSTNIELGRLLENVMHASDYSGLGEVQKRNVYLLKKRCDEQTALPNELVAEMAKQSALTVDIWKKAKATKDYAMLKSDLGKLLDLEKKAAEVLMKVKNTATPYDALIDMYEPGMTAQAISGIFNELREGLVPLIERCQNAPNQPDTKVLKRRVPIDHQRKLAQALAEFVHYDATSKESGGRIDETEHPFTVGYYDDVRITTHYYEEGYTSSIFGVLHEAGHALYEQNLPRDWMYQPVGSACSSGFHESQSRFVENIIGRSAEFWTSFYPKLREATGSALAEVSKEEFVHAINLVNPSKIRVGADEVTYGLHIIIRFEVERDLFADKITVDELPEIWNQRYKDYLGLEIEHDSEGVMQDVHLAGGRYGSFLCYALGNIYGGQMLATMERSLTDWRGQLMNGRFDEILNWLTRNVYAYGNLYDPADLIKKIAGTELSIKPFLSYLNQKYSSLYEY